MNIFKYNKVINEIREKYHPTCSDNCLWKPYIFKANIYRMPYPLRKVNELCSKCNKTKKSEYRHQLCHKCAEIYDDEFDYFHKSCSLHFDFKFTKKFDF